MSDKVQGIEKFWHPMSVPIDTGKVGILLPRNSKVGKQLKEMINSGKIVYLKKKSPK